MAIISAKEMYNDLKKNGFKKVPEDSIIGDEYDCWLNEERKKEYKLRENRTRESFLECVKKNIEKNKEFYEECGTE